MEDHVEEVDVSRHKANGISSFFDFLRALHLAFISPFACQLSSRFLKRDF